MIRLPKRETKLLVAIHGWSGIVLGLLLYAVVLTGMIAVFAHEIGEWSAGATDPRGAFERPVDPVVRRIAAQTPARYRESLDISETGTHDLRMFFHRHETAADGTPEERGIMWHVDRSGAVTLRREGNGEDAYGPDNASALERFVVDTHVRLHVPNPWGLLLTGIVGLAMLVAAISGLLIHRHLFKDIFTLRRAAKPVLAARDVHSVAGTWSLPFAFILAFTGSFFSFAGTVGIPAMAMVAFGGDQTQTIETLFGAPAAADSRPVAIGNLDRVIADARRRAGDTPTFLSIGNFGRADATVTTFHEPREGALTSASLVYNGATGAFAREKPAIGTAPSMGGALFGLMGPLHFGSFAGVLSKAVWLGLGFATCYVVLTGMQLWLRRREGERPGLARLDRLVSVIGYGLPLALAVSAIGYFGARPFGSAAWWTPAAFMIAAAAAILGGILARDGMSLDRWLRRATGALLIVIPLLRLVLGGPGWGTAIAIGEPIFVALDLGLVIAGLALIRATSPARGLTRADVAPALQAAE